MKKLLIILVLLSIGTAAACPSGDVFTHQIKKSLFNYLQNPASSRLTLYELKDILTVYLGDDFESENCSQVIGNESGLPISTILAKANAISDEAIPRCSDGTMYGECSVNLPKFCYSGMLKYMCYGPDHIAGTSDDCGCPEYQTCDTDGSCRKSDISCYSDEDCGTSMFVGGKYCQGGDVYRDYINFTCISPGTASSHCTYANENILIESCPVDCTAGSCSG
jgi:hypothetical protein